MNKLQWWGYVHTSGTLHLKRYFDQRDTQEAHESPFCARVFGPWEADTHEEALRILREKAAQP